MEIYERRSPVTLAGTPADTERRGDWTVVTRYENEGDGPHLVDLSHRPKWDLQDRELGRFQPLSVEIPLDPNGCRLANGVAVNRMNRTQAQVWQLAGETADPPDDGAYTDVTDTYLLLALLGERTLEILEKVSALDLGDPSAGPPRLLQGPVSHVPCQVVLLGEAGGKTGVLVACSRGYGASMASALLHAGAEFGLKPAGESAFGAWAAELFT